MSTLMDSVAGKGQNLSTRAWAAILVLSLIVFGANTLYATTKAARVGGASTAASNLQVNSQRLAVQAQDAVSGNADSYKALRATKEQIDGDVKSLNDNFGNATGVSGPIKSVTATWAPLAKGAEQVLAAETQVLALVGHAASVTAKASAGCGASGAGGCAPSSARVSSQESESA